jgi:hypothetical protein
MQDNSDTIVVNSTLCYLLKMLSTLSRKVPTYSAQDRYTTTSVMTIKYVYSETVLMPLHSANSSYKVFDLKNNILLYSISVKK